MKDEISILKEMDHPNIVKLYDTFDEKMDPNDLNEQQKQ